MDKRQLYKNIALMKQRIFALTACLGFGLVVFGTILGNGMNFNILLRNSIFGLLGFGVLGYLWGMYYERVVEPALMESHRNESQRRMEELKGNPNQRFLSDMSVDEVQPNMISISAVHNKDGALLVREGAKLTERMIQNLRANSIASIKVEAQHRQVSTDDY